MSWMELVSVYFKKLDVEAQQAWDSWEDSFSPIVIAGRDASALLRAGDALGRGRTFFPMLTKVWGGSELYKNDYFALWLKPEEVLLLLDEFQRLRRVFKREEYVHKLDGPLVYEEWRKFCLARPDKWEDSLDDVERFLARAIEEEYWLNIELT
jgi:hypothetical protein